MSVCRVLEGSTWSFPTADVRGPALAGESLLTGSSGKAPQRKRVLVMGELGTKGRRYGGGSEVWEGDLSSEKQQVPLIELAW